MTKVFNRSQGKAVRRALRGNMPPAEVLLWTRLRRKGVKGFRFRRQYGIGRFVVDFYCPCARLAVEIDGESHFVHGAGDKDNRRQNYIESFGIRFLRVTNRDIYENIEGVLEAIAELVSDLPPAPSL